MCLVVRVCVCPSLVGHHQSVSQSVSIGCVAEAELTALCWRSKALVNNEGKCHLDISSAF